MPLYEFYCEKCDHVEEEILLLKDRKKTRKCGKCSNTLVRLVGNPIFNLIGDGFYQNDYKQHSDAKKELVKMKKERNQREE